MTNRTRPTLSFSGRASELETLIARWRMACNMESPIPQVVLLKAERGLGKTRLALEFYRWLNENVDGWLTKRYWPDARGIVGENLEVNPDPYHCTYEIPIPYLWWGLRAVDGVAGDAIATYDRYLAPHLVALLVRASMKNRAWAVAEAWRDVGFDLASSALQVDTILSIGKGILSTAKIIFGATTEAPRDLAMELPVSRAAAVLSDMEKVFKPGTMTFAKTPGVIFLDDAQFAREDAALPTFIERLIHMSVAQRWPILILITHWKKELATDLASELSFATLLRRLREGSAKGDGPDTSLSVGFLTVDNFAEIDLHPLADLSGALHDKLPGLTEEQSAAILAFMGGNPRFLEQVIAFLLEHENFFENFDPRRALTVDGLEQTLGETRSQEIFKIVLRRLREAPEDVQEAICLASLQGVRFAKDLVDVQAQDRLGHAVRESLRRGEDPYSMLVGTAKTEEPVGLFAERLFQQVAQQRRQTLKSLGGEPSLQRSFKETVTALVDNGEYLKNASSKALILIHGIAADLFERSSRPEERFIAQRSLLELGWLELSRYSYESATAAYERLLASEPHSLTPGEGRNRIELWDRLGMIYRKLKWPAKAARAYGKVFWGIANGIPDGFDIFLRASDGNAARECFERWKQKHADQSPDIYLWGVRTMASALLNLSELARAQPDLEIADGDDLFKDASFIVHTRPRFNGIAEERKPPVPEHLEQAAFLQQRAYSQDGVLGGSEVEKEHSELLDRLARAAESEADFPAAQEFLLRALQIDTGIGDELSQIAKLNDLGMIAGRRGNSSASDEYLEKARELAEGILAEDTFLVKLVVDEEEAGQSAPKPRTIGSVAVPVRFLTEMDKNSQAVIGKVRWLKQLAADIYGNLAGRAQQEGMLAKAREGFLRSLNIRKEVGDKEGMTIDLRNLGKLSRVEGDLATACSYWRECVEIFRELERRDVGTLHVRSWTDAIKEMMEGMRASGCTDDANREV
jgi:tetratricopeptide (TPR) repeat protein